MTGTGTSYITCSSHSKVKRTQERLFITMSYILTKHKWHWNVWEGAQNTMHNNIQYWLRSSEGHLLVLISPARVESSMLFKTSTRVVQVTGCLPLPFNHSWRIFVLISSALSLHSRIMLSTLAPRSSSSRNVPNILYCVPICWGILILLSRPGKLNSSRRVGVLLAAWS